MTTPSIFVNNTTVIDLSRFTFSGGFVGDSLNLHCLVKGPLSSDERVVIDFSTGKKAIKAAIDLHSTESSADNDLWCNGFDHKTWIPTLPLYRNLTIEEQVMFDDFSFQVEGDSTHCALTNAGLSDFKLTIPRNALKLIPVDILIDLENDDTQSLERFVGEYLSNHLPSLEITAFVDRSHHTEILERIFGRESHVEQFRYCHGLRNSTSFGCQNILHGHYSIVASRDPLEAERIAEYLDNTYLFDEEIQKSSEQRFEYQTTARGEFTYSPSVISHRKLHAIDGDPTIENIASHVAGALNIQHPFFLSEGLQKGCFFERA